MTASFDLQCVPQTSVKVAITVQGTPGHTWRLELNGDVADEHLPLTGGSVLPYTYSLGLGTQTNEFKVYDDTSGSPGTFIARKVFTTPVDCGPDTATVTKVTCDRILNTARIYLNISGHVQYYLDSTGHSTSTGVAPDTYIVSAAIPSSVIINVHNGTPSGPIYPGTITVNLPAQCPPWPATSLSSATSTTIPVGKNIVESTTLRSGSTPLKGVGVDLFSSPGPAGPWSHVATRVTSATGVAGITMGPRTNTYYQWKFIGSQDFQASNSPVQRVAVAQIVLIRSPLLHVRHGWAVTLWGTVAPNEIGQYVNLMTYSKGWHVSSTVKAIIKLQKMPDGVTRYGYLLKFRPTGAYYRTYRAATSTNAAASSPQVTVTYY